MGDRACVSVITDAENPPVTLYGHWSGSTYVEDVRAALAKGWRWDDAPYLARIVWDEFVGRDTWGEETGFGIGVGHGESFGPEHPTVYVDVPRQKVYLTSTWSPDSHTAGLTFEEFAGGS